MEGVKAVTADGELMIETTPTEESPPKAKDNKWRVTLTVMPPQERKPEKGEHDLPEEVLAAREEVQGWNWTGGVHDLPTIEQLEWAYLQAVLLSYGGNKSKTAEALGIDRRTLYRRLEKGAPLRKKQG